MNNIGFKIKEIRNSKGFSQEDLAEVAKVNVRTIQRIENGESEPRGATLNLICSALDITTEDIYDYGKEENNGYLVMFHLSVLAAFLIPLGNIVLPLILYSSNKNKIKHVDILGPNVLNFQIIISALTYTSMFSYIYLSLSKTPGNHLWLVYIFGMTMILSIILPVILAIATHRSKNVKMYPQLLKIIK